MSNAGVLARSPEPEARDKVLDNNPDQIGNLEMLVFVFYLSTKTITASIYLLVIAVG